jgi:hypothetical protein
MTRGRAVIPLAALLALAGCAVPEPKVVVVEVPARAAPATAASYSAQLDRACARYVRARQRHPEADPAAAAAGDKFCLNVPAHAGPSPAQDARWLRNLTRRIER